VDCRSSEPARCLCSKSLLKLNGRETTFNLFWSLKVSEPIRMCLFFCMGSLHLDLDFFLQFIYIILGVLLEHSPPSMHT
jgi:hypothetical protein